MVWQRDVVLCCIRLHHSSELLKLKVLLLKVVAHVDWRCNEYCTTCKVGIASSDDLSISEHEHFVCANAHNSPHRPLVDGQTLLALLQCTDESEKVELNGRTRSHEQIEFVKEEH